MIEAIDLCLCRIDAAGQENQRHATLQRIGRDLHRIGDAGVRAWQRAQADGRSCAIGPHGATGALDMKSGMLLSDAGLGSTPCAQLVSARVMLPGISSSQNQTTVLVLFT